MTKNIWHTLTMQFQDLAKALNTVDVSLALEKQALLRSQDTLEFVLFPLVKRWSKSESVISRTLVAKVFPNCYQKATNSRVKGKQ